MYHDGDGGGCVGAGEDCGGNGGGGDGYGSCD